MLGRLRQKIGRLLDEQVLVRLHELLLGHPAASSTEHLFAIATRRQIFAPSHLVEIDLTVLKNSRFLLKL